MQTPIQRLSIEAMTYLALQTAFTRRENPYGFQDEFSFESIIIENIQEWSNALNGLSVTNDEDLQIVRQTLEHEFEHGSYIERDAESFLENLAFIVGDKNENSAFYKLAKEIVFRVKS